MEGLQGGTSSDVRLDHAKCTFRPLAALGAHGEVGICVAGGPLTPRVVDGVAGSNNRGDFESR